MEGCCVEQEFVQRFFARDELPQVLASLCDSNSKAADPVTSTVLMFINSSLQIQLTAVGLQPFAGKDVTFPYHHMSVAQTEFLLRLVNTDGHWSVYPNSMKVRWSHAQQKLDALDVLECVCVHIMSSQSFPDKRSRLALCNIILQRLQASCPLVPSLQANLNERLFGEACSGVKRAISI